MSVGLCGSVQLSMDLCECGPHRDDLCEDGLLQVWTSVRMDFCECGPLNLDLCERGPLLTWISKNVDL